MTATLKIENDIALVTMGDGKANAISLAMLESVNTALDEAEKFASVIILTGRPKRFSAGFDLKFLSTSAPEDVRRLGNGGGKLAFRLFTSKQPIIIAVTGHAIAMGAFLLLGADTPIGARGAYKIGANETINGMTPPGFGVELPRARLYEPDEAVPVGWLDQVVEPGEVHAAAMAEPERLKPIANGAYWRNKILARQPAIDAIRPSLAD